MDSINLALICASFFMIAMLYSSIGHAGASGYLAVMALLSFAPESIKPTSLVLNIVVAFIASIQFIRAGYFDRKIFLTFMITSMPLAFYGGHLSLEPKYFKLAVGIFLILSSLILFSKQFIQKAEKEIKKMPPSVGMILGAMIGFVSGIVGVGGGIFLSPILVIANWADIKNAAGVAALFILVNSISALAGNLSSLRSVDSHLFFWIVSVLLGGVLGSFLGTKKLPRRMITYCLVVVLLSAGIKFAFIDFFRVH